METLKVLALCGSLRQESLNRKLMQQAIALAPRELTIEEGKIGALPLYSQDIQQMGFPEPVELLHRQLMASDALLLISPEYNYSIPGVLKNAIDWLSRYSPHGFNNKPVALMGASPGRMGTCRCQYHLRQVMVFLNAWVLNRPEVMLSEAHLAFDEQDALRENRLQELVASQLAALRQMIHD
ncbi:NAD(P)H-dependent oxidoreductase [Ferrimonas sediminicola]|uniref:NAD(P)H-dependent oxidoreductase n=1 Tax=Ferrimonas sediminicola TaxID=2569538 RepID=A0A4V5NXT2_9GAMM|nr:NADPH-dependent FMN reductase [Ferrimonas sediminicola]TKB49789.1 NAD(P)H-dependent oxidoreductase [Ferrimonas sediminicola]